MDWTNGVELFIASMGNIRYVVGLIMGVEIVRVHKYIKNREKD